MFQVRDEGRAMLMVLEWAEEDMGRLLHLHQTDFGTPFQPKSGSNRQKEIAFVRTMALQMAKVHFHPHLKNKANS